MLAVVVMAVLLLLGCKNVELVPVETVHTEHHWHTDSIHQSDTIIKETQTTIMQLDSEAMARYGIHLRAAERAWLVRTAELEQRISELAKMTATHDTIHDTIPKPYPVPVFDQGGSSGGLTWWQQTRMHVGGIVMLVLLIWGFVKFGLPRFRR